MPPNTTPIDLCTRKEVLKLKDKGKSYRYISTQLPLSAKTAYHICKNQKNVLMRPKKPNRYRIKNLNAKVIKAYEDALLCILVTENDLYN
jgi:orotate phosphoribosyltransferase-like protein